MKVIKPKTLSALTRCYEFERRQYFSVGILSLHTFSHDMASEVDLWKFLAMELGAEGVPDAGMPKTRAEFLVTGSAYQANGQTLTTADVRVQLGGIQKQLRVTGDRFWDGNAATEPMPFSELPITWGNAFGGPGFEPNPLGKGFAPIQAKDGATIDGTTIDDTAIFALPNVEHSSDLVKSTFDRPAPQSFGPIDFTWPQRSKKAGTYDEVWLKEQFPGYATDMDWSIFNLAADDQQQQTSFIGTESFVIDGMHPRKQQLHGTLPAVTAKCFFTQHALGSTESFQEIALRLTTVWFFPHREMYLLVHHGSHEITTSDGSDVQHLVLAAESMNAPKPIEHYHNVLIKRLDKDNGPLLSLRDDDLLPDEVTVIPDAATAEMQNLIKTDGLKGKHQRIAQQRRHEETRASIAALGLDPDEYGPPPLPPDESSPELEDLEEFLAEKKTELEQQSKQYGEKSAEQMTKLRAELASMGYDADELLGPEQLQVIGPPTYSAEAEIKTLRQAVAPYAGMKEVDAVETFLVEQRQMFVDNEANSREHYRLMAHTQTAVERLTGDAADTARKEVLARIADGRGLIRADMTGFDLSGLDLSGCDLTEAWLENVNLAGANLERAILTGAVLSRANLTDTQLNGADLTKANLGLAQFVRTSANDANFSQAILSKAHLAEADFVNANFESADLAELSITSADMSGASLAELFLHKCSLRGVRFAGATLSSSHFIECDLSGVDFSTAKLDGATFVTAQGDGANFAGADLSGSRFVEQCSFRKANFRGANLNTVNFRGTSLQESDFSESVLTGSDLSTADCTKATFRHASARNALFMHTVLTDATLARADLMNAILQDAVLVGADVSTTNLYQADLANVHQDIRTTFAGANLKKARMLPKRALV